MQLPMEGTNPGKAFREGRPMMAGNGPGYVPFSALRMWVIDAEGLRSSMILPLVLNDKSQGWSASCSGQPH